MKTALVLAIIILVSALGMHPTARKECNDAFKESKFWAEQYKLRPLAVHGFNTLIRTIHMNHYIYTEEGERIISDKHPFIQMLIIYPTNYTVGFKRYEHDVLYNFYAGDTVTFYELDVKTGTMNVTRLGFHSNIYFTAIERGNWRAIHVERHAEETAIVFGITMFVNKEDIGSHSHSRSWTANRTELLQDFPKHSEIITRFTDNEIKASTSHG